MNIKIQAKNKEYEVATIDFDDKINQITLETRLKYVDNLYEFILNNPIDSMNKLYIYLIIDQLTDDVLFNIIKIKHKFLTENK